MRAQTVSAFNTGDRVQTHPATDRRMAGDRYGTVSRVGRKYVTVDLDRSGRSIRFHPSNILPIDPTPAWHGPTDPADHANEWNAYLRSVDAWRAASGRDTD